MVPVNYFPVYTNEVDAMGIDEYADVASEMMDDISKILPVLSASFDEQPVHTLTYLNHTEAYEMFTSSTRKSHYFPLVSGFDAQVNQFYCGPAALQATLNSLRPLLGERVPLDPLYQPYRYFTQYDIFMSE